MSKSLEFAVVTTFFWWKKYIWFLYPPQSLANIVCRLWEMAFGIQHQIGGLFGREFSLVQIRALKKVNMYIYIYGTHMFICMCTYIPLHIYVYIYYTVGFRCVYVYSYTHFHMYTNSWTPPSRVGGSSTYVASWTFQSRPKLEWRLCTKMDSETLFLVWQVSMFRKYKTNLKNVKATNWSISSNHLKSHVA